MRTRTVAWVFAAALLACVCVWPMYAGLVAADDDLKFLRNLRFEGTLGEGLRAAWNASGAFRPLEIIIAAGCDRVTLACPPVVPVQIAGLLALAVGTVMLTRKIAPAHPIAAPLLLVWIALSPATTVSLWQMDTCSQTWSAALAVWAGLSMWRSIGAARAGRVDWLSWCALLAIFAVGATVKEIFYGWSAGIGVALFLVLINLWRTNRAAARRAALLIVPVVALPLLHLFIRLKFGGLATTEDSHDRYSVTLGENVLMNSAFSLAGAFANGPLHLLRDELASPLLRVLPLVSAFAAFCIVAAAGGFRVLHRAAPATVQMRPLLLCAGAAILSLTVTLPMGSVSELYGFGANIGSGLLVVYAIIMLWNPVAQDERLLCRSVAGLGTAVLLLAGCYGLASRAYHFELTWKYARSLNEIVLAHQRTLVKENIVPSAIVFLNTDCFWGRSHSTYAITPARSIGLRQTEEWLRRNDPKHKITLTVEPAALVRPGVDLVVDCALLPHRGHW